MRGDGNDARDARVFQRDLKGGSMAERRTFDATSMLQAACVRRGIDLAALVAEIAIWANPEVHRRLVAANGTGAFFPGCRRAKAGSGEERGGVADGGTLDDNTRANHAIKHAVGVRPKDIKGFEACHLWPGTTYDTRYHTVIANLVLLPRALAGLSDHDADVLAKLQYRAFELYGWHPEEAAPPVKPLNYPACWREPEPFTPELAKALARRLKRSSRSVAEPVHQPQPPRQGDVVTEASDLTVDGRMPSDELGSVITKIQRWATKPNTIAHRTIGLVLRAQVPQTRQHLARAIEESTSSANGSGVVASLLTSKGNAYGRVLIELDGIISLHPDVADEIGRHRWS